jgi:hypothetical protein
VIDTKRRNRIQTSFWNTLHAFLDSDCLKPAGAATVMPALLRPTLPGSKAPVAGNLIEPFSLPNI